MTTNHTPGATAEAFLPWNHPIRLDVENLVQRHYDYCQTHLPSDNRRNLESEIVGRLQPLLARVTELEKERDDAIRDSDEYAAQAERERDQRQREVGSQEYRGNTVSYMYDKAKCYGDMVHGCSPALAAAGFPPDEFAKDGQVGAIARAVTAMAKQLAAAKGAVRALNNLIKNEWMVSVDWCPYEDRQTVLEECRTALAACAAAGLKEESK